MIVISLALVFVASAFYLAATYSADSVKISQAQDAVERLASGADYVYALGPNSKDYVVIYMPQDLQIANVSGNRVLFTLHTSAGTTDIFANSEAQLIGSLPSSSGRQRILIQYLPSGKVLIGEAGLACSPATISNSLNAGEAGTYGVTITNNADFQVTGINATLSGAVASFMSPSQPPSGLRPEESGGITLTYSIPSEQASGVYGGTLQADSQNDGSCVPQLTIQVNGASSCSALCVSQGYSQGACRASSSSCIAAGEDYAPGNDYACSQPNPSCCCGPTGDKLGPVVTGANHTPQNASPSTPMTISATCSDATTGGSYISSAELQLDGGAFSQMQADDGEFSDAVTQGVLLDVGSLSGGQHIAGIRCTDTVNNTGALHYYFFSVSSSDSIGPIVTSMNHSEGAPTTLSNITESGFATDAYTGNSSIASCSMRADLGSWMNATPDDGAFDSVSEAFHVPLGTLSVGTHTIYSYCTDALGNVGGMANDTFGVSDIDLMLIMDRSGSMACEDVYHASDGTVTSSSTTPVLAKTLEV